MKFSSFFPFAGLLLFGVIPAHCLAQQATAPTASAVVQLVEKFDRNGDHRLEGEERQAAFAYLAKLPLPLPAPATGRTSATPAQGIALEVIKPGAKIAPAAVPSFPDQPLYQPGVLRTLFIEFENPDWAKELAGFARTDVLVPATLQLDGKNYAGIGVRFKDASPTPATGEGYKRALSLTLDYTLTGQNVSGQKQLVLLDSATDPTFLRTILYNHVARQYLPAPRSNLVQVVINGENWGAYVSVEPLETNFIQKNFATTEGSWWSVSSGGNLSYLGDKLGAYQNTYHLRSKEDPAAWTALIDLCRILNQTPARQIEGALANRLDIDSALRFLALENVMINQAGYGSSDGEYGLYLGKNGRFQLIPQSGESSFRFVEVSEYEKSSRGGNRGRERPNSTESKTDAEKNSPDKPSGETVKKSYNPNNFPRQAATDLAMLLSYSFVNKADSDFDSKVNREEWLAFARSWFLVMDEDLVGKLTRDQFLVKFRGVLTPASVADGRTKQTFGKDDAAAIIGQDFFKVLDQNQDGMLTSQEVTDTFAQWFSEWSTQKKAVITQPVLQRAFNTLFSKTIFQAEQSYIARRDAPVREDEAGAGRERGHGGGNGIGLGPLRIGGGNRGGGSSTLVTFNEELDPLAGLDDTNKPLLAKLLAVPVLRTRYLEYVREITETWLSWSKLGPVAKEYRDLIGDEVDKETHKATSYIHFVQQYDQETAQGPRNGEAASSLKSFVTERRGYLLKDDNVMGRIEGP